MCHVLTRIVEVKRAAIGDIVSSLWQRIVRRNICIILHEIELPVHNESVWPNMGVIGGGKWGNGLLAVGASSRFRVPVVGTLRENVKTEKKCGSS